MDAELNPDQAQEQDGTAQPDAADQAEYSPPDPAEGPWNHIEPRGAMAFVILMFILYMVYWFATYFEIFVIRGA